MNKVAFHTLGCKLNFSETSTIGAQFLKHGFNIVDYNDRADVYVINTCTVTDNADRECRQIVRRALRNNPDAFVLVTGCYAQLRSDEIAKIEGVDAVLGSNEKFNLFSYIENFEKKELSCIYVSPTEKLDSFNSSFSTDASSRTRAFFKIQDGCDYKCSFCTIPLARGKSRSAAPDVIVNEFKNLLFRPQEYLAARGEDELRLRNNNPAVGGVNNRAYRKRIPHRLRCGCSLEAGYKEIILTGVNVGDYQSFLSLNHNRNLTLEINQEQDQSAKGGQKQKIDLYSLLKMMLQVEGDYRIRISSIEPNLLTDEILDLTANDERMCNHFHIPLQSGSQNILKLMQRRYRIEDYEKLILKAHKQIKDLGIGVDVIVGFPGETEENFLETYNFLKNLPVSYLHVFTYSERPNTKAIGMPDQVDIVERKRRSNMLRILSEKKRHRFYQEMVGKELTVLFEHEDHNGFMKGFSSNYVRIKAPYSSEIINKFVKVKIAEVDENICTAENLSINESPLKLLKLSAGLK